MAHETYRDAGLGGGPNWNPKTKVTNSPIVNKFGQNGLDLYNKATTPTTPTYSGGGGGVSTPTAGAGSNVLLDALQAQMAARQAAIDAANDALDQAAGVAKDRYNTSKKEVARNYQDLKNQASVQNFRARRTQREALADRGALNTGAGMQENIRLASNFNNNMNKIGTQEATAYEQLLNDLNQYLAQIESQKAANMASGLNDFGSTISNMINASFSGYTPGQNYYDLLNALTPQAGMTNVVQGDNNAKALSNSLFDLLLHQY